MLTLLFMVASVVAAFLVACEFWPLQTLAALSRLFPNDVAQRIVYYSQDAFRFLAPQLLPLLANRMGH